jgi:micrococcal nuclease
MKKLALSIFLCFVSISALAVERVTSPVISIADGDTITILSPAKKQIKIRFAGIDCPERGQPWGRNATEALKALLAEEPVSVDIIDTDRYGRSIGRVYAKGIELNRELVKTGSCWVYPRYAKDKKLFDLQNEAQAAKRGLWQLLENERVPPWEWRRK